MRALLLSLLGVAIAGVMVGSSSAVAPAAQTPDIAALVAEVDQQRIQDHIAAIDEPRHAVVQPSALQAAADYVEGQLASFAYTVTLDPVTFNEVTSDNVIAVHQGASCPERVFVVGAHYDSVSVSPGADDNASGVAGMLEIARILENTPLPATVWFTGFTMEENQGGGFLVGSTHMVEQEVSLGTEFVGMLSLEMIAYTIPSSDEYILVLGSEASGPLVESAQRARDTYVPGLPFVAATVPGNGETVPDSRRSDHVPFWDAGYQALLVTDTANFRNPNYHQATDTIDTLDLGFATNVTRAMLATTIDFLTYDATNDGEADVCQQPPPKPPDGDTDGDTIPNSTDPDDDNDGCTDVAELGPKSEAATGGGRDPHYYWDFMDMWVNKQKDQVVNIIDIGAIVQRFLTAGDPGGDPLDPPQALTGYHVSADRSPPIGANVWNAGPPDGVINIIEVGLAVAQFFHDCN